MCKLIVNKYNNEYHSIVEDTQRIERILQGHSQTANQTPIQQSMQHIENIPSQSDAKVKFIENAMKISWFNAFDLLSCTGISLIHNGLWAIMDILFIRIFGKVYLFMIDYLFTNHGFALMSWKWKNWVQITVNFYDY